VSSRPTEEGDDIYCDISNRDILQTMKYFRARIRTLKMETESGSESVHLNNMTPSEATKTRWSIRKTA
jgi:adenylate cyclase class IV